MHCGFVALFLRPLLEEVQIAALHKRRRKERGALRSTYCAAWRSALLWPARAQLAEVVAVISAAVTAVFCLSNGSWACCCLHSRTRR